MSVMTDQGATFSRDLLVTLGLDQRGTIFTRALMLIAERADHGGMAEFEAGELIEMLTLSDGSLPREGLVLAAVHSMRDQGYLIGRPTLRKVRVAREHVQPVGVTVAGARYGRLVLRKPDGKGRWSVQCDCGNVRNYSERHLVAGLAYSCGTACIAVKRRLPVAA